MAWLDDERALLVLHVLSDARGLGIVDERRAETAGWAAGY